MKLHARLEGVIGGRAYHDSETSKLFQKPSIKNELNVWQYLDNMISKCHLSQILVSVLFTGVYFDHSYYGNNYAHTETITKRSIEILDVLGYYPVDREKNSCRNTLLLQERQWLAYYKAFAKKVMVSGTITMNWWISKRKKEWNSSKLVSTWRTRSLKIWNSDSTPFRHQLSALAGGKK